MSSPKIFKRVTNNKVYRTQVDPSRNGLPSIITCTTYTNYCNSYLRRVHRQLKKSCLVPCDVYVHRNLKGYHSHPGSPPIWFHSTYSQLVISGPLSCMRLGLFMHWHLGMLTWQHYTNIVWQHYTNIVFQGKWLHWYFFYLIEKLAWHRHIGCPGRHLLGNRYSISVFGFPTKVVWGAWYIESAIEGLWGTMGLCVVPKTVKHGV